MNKQPLSRRAALRGLGVSIALPYLEAMLPRATADNVVQKSRPQRAAFVYLPNGVRLDTWFPSQQGPDFTLSPTLAPLAKIRTSLTVLGGLDRTFVAGTGVHAQCGACWLTSSPPTEPRDGGFPTNTSLDQILARHLGVHTPLPSLELSCNDHADNKETKYFESISWYSPGYAANVEKNPRAVFQRLFGKTKGRRADASVLDVVGAGAALLRAKLGRNDRAKLEEYLESVRATERRIQAADKRPNPPPGTRQPDGIPEKRSDYIRLMGDLMVLAFQLDLTRVASLVVDPERWDSPRLYDGVFDNPLNHHVLTHTKGDEAREKIARIDRFHLEQCAYFVEKLATIPDGPEGRTLLDHSVVVIGSGISDGDTHNYKDLPVALLGRAGGALKTGFHKTYPGERPLADLWLTLLHALGIPTPRFADSSGLVRELLV